MSAEDFLKSNPDIIDAYEVVATYEMYVKDVEGKLKVKVLKMLSADSPSYMGVPNLEVKGKGCADYYRSTAIKPTAEEALRDAVDGFFAFLGEEAEIQEVEDW